MQLARLNKSKQGRRQQIRLAHPSFLGLNFTDGRLDKLLLHLLSPNGSCPVPFDLVLKNLASSFLTS